MVESGSGSWPAFVDVHHHAGPDLYRRRHGVLAAGREYARHGGWVVVKSHLGSTAASAWEARQEGLPVSASVTLNDIGGGVHPRVVEQAVYQHGDDSPARLVVYLPTVVGEPVSAWPRAPFHPRLNGARLKPLRASDGNGELTRETREVLRAARDLPVIVATGHADRAEILRIVDEAVRVGLDRLLLTHPTHPMCGLTTEDLASLAAVPEVHVEVTALTRLLGRHDDRQLTEVLHAHPRIVYSSDLGQPDQPDVQTWLDISQGWFTEAGLNPKQIRAITRENPRSVLSTGRAWQPADAAEQG